MLAASWKGQILTVQMAIACYYLAEYTLARDHLAAALESAQVYDQASLSGNRERAAHALNNIGIVLTSFSFSARKVPVGKIFARCSMTVTLNGIAVVPSSSCSPDGL